MSYRFMKVFGLRRSGCILLGSLGLLVGCEEAGPTDSLDAGVSTHAQRPGTRDDSTTKGPSGSGSTDVLSVSVDLEPGSTSDDQLSVALENGSDAGGELTLDADVAADPDATSGDALVPTEPDVTTSEFPDTSEPSAPAASSGGNGTPDETPTSDELTYVDAPDTSTPPVPSTSEPSSTSEPVDPTSSSIPPFPGQLTGVASWIDVPGHFEVTAPNVSPFTVEWSLAAVPERSRLTTADLVDPKTSVTRFVPDASGKYTAQVKLTANNYEYVAEVSVEVAAVDVAFVATAIKGEPTDYPPYYRSHQMLSSEPGSPPRQVGCSFESNSYFWSGDFQANGQPTLGFRYPRVPGEQTLFAYRMEYASGENNPISSTHVVTSEGDCAKRRPGDMELAINPTFDGDGKSLVYISGNNRLAPIKRAELGAAEGKALLEPRDPFGLTWWGGGNGGILWSGALDDWQRQGVGFVDVSHLDLGWAQHCGEPSSHLEEIEAGADFFIGYVAGTWWYHPFSVDGRFAFNCKLVQPLFQALPQPERIHDVAIAPDGKTIAFIDERYDEQKQLVISLRVGPVETLLNGEFKGWIAEVLSPQRQYSGIQWIAGSEQLAFTEFDLDYSLRIEDFIPYEAAIWRVNRDGSRRTEMLRVKSEKSEYHVVNTGSLPRAEVTY